MRADSEGFDYPVINHETCTECGLCVRICPISNHWNNPATFDFPQVFAAYHQSERVRSKSASGGIFPALAQSVLEDKGMVFGAAFDEHFRLSHIGVETETELGPLIGSKYVQSRIGAAFKEVKNVLKRNKPVLFTGTPCQIVGLYNFLQRDDDHLFTCDLICHGVPSPKVFQKYIGYLEESHNSKVIQYKFRSKYFGWHSYGIQITFANGKIINTTNQQDPYTIGFLDNLFLRPICSICPYTSLHRHADITIGDFWGIEKYMPELNDNKGVSAILVNTAKGSRLFEGCQSLILTRQSEVQQVIQPSLVSPSIPSSHRASFFADLDRLSFGDVQRIYISGFLPTIRRKIIQYKHAILNFVQKKSRRPRERVKVAV